MRPPSAASPSAESIQEDEIPLAVMAGHMKKFSENTSTTPEVMDSSTLIFNPNFNFKFPRFFLGGRGNCQKSRKIFRGFLAVTNFSEWAL